MNFNGNRNTVSSSTADYLKYSHNITKPLCMPETLLTIPLMSTSIHCTISCCSDTIIASYVPQLYNSRFSRFGGCRPSLNLCVLLPLLPPPPSGVSWLEVQEHTWTDAPALHSLLNLSWKAFRLRSSSKASFTLTDGSVKWHLQSKWNTTCLACSSTAPFSGCLAHVVLSSFSVSDLWLLEELMPQCEAPQSCDHRKCSKIGSFEPRDKAQCGWVKEGWCYLGIETHLGFSIKYCNPSTIKAELDVRPQCIPRHPSKQSMEHSRE